MSGLPNSDGCAVRLYLIDVAPFDPDRLTLDDRLLDASPITAVIVVMVAMMPTVVAISAVPTSAMSVRERAG